MELKIEELEKDLNIFNVNDKMNCINEWKIVLGRRTTSKKHFKLSLLEKYPTLFFCKNLVYFNEARLHEVTFNPNTHA